MIYCYKAYGNIKMIQCMECTWMNLLSKNTFWHKDEYKISPDATCPIYLYHAIKRVIFCTTKTWNNFLIDITFLLIWACSSLFSIIIDSFTTKVYDEMEDYLGEILTGHENIVEKWNICFRLPNAPFPTMFSSHVSTETSKGSIINWVMGKMFFYNWNKTIYLAIILCLETLSKWFVQEAYLNTDTIFKI